MKNNPMATAILPTSSLFWVTDMPTVWTYDIKYSGTYPIFPPTSYIRSEAFEAFGRAIKNGYYAEMWDDGKLIQRMGPHSILPR